MSQKAKHPRVKAGAVVDVQITDLIESIRESVLITDASGRIEAVNSAFTAVSGYSAADVVGQNPRVLKSGVQDQLFYETLWATIRKQGYWQGEIWNRRKNGQIYPEWLTISVIRNRHGEPIHYVGVFTDISERKNSENCLTRLAYHDELTGLPNRSLFQNRLAQGISQTENSKKPIAVVFIDLDHFKTINDTLGHESGDTLLKIVAERFARCIRQGDTLSRFGGDEFAAVLINLKDSQTAARVAQDIVHTLDEPVHVLGRDFKLSASVGLALYPRDGQMAHDLLLHADQAMYEAKTRGKNQYCFFSS